MQCSWACMQAGHIWLVGSPAGLAPLQDNDNEWSETLAQRCLKYGMALIGCGWGQPPMRKAALRVMHKNKQVNNTVCLETTCLK